MVRMGRLLRTTKMPLALLICVLFSFVVIYPSVASERFGRLEGTVKVNRGYVLVNRGLT